MKNLEKVQLKMKKKYLRHFNSTKVSEFIIEKTLDKNDKRYYWEK